MDKKIILMGLTILILLGIIVGCQKQQTTGNVILFKDAKLEQLKPVEDKKPLQTRISYYEDDKKDYSSIRSLDQAFTRTQEVSCSFLLPSSRNDEGQINIKGEKFVLDLLKRRTATRIVFDGHTYYVYERDEDEGWQFKESEVELFKQYHNDIDFLSKEELIAKATGVKCKPDNFSDSIFRRPERIEFGDVITELIRDGIYPR
ncbi:MAG: hypothetical protein QW331_00770 [Candidatus Woesearchaeota archaeon]